MCIYLNIPTIILKMFLLFPSKIMPCRLHANKPHDRQDINTSNSKLDRLKLGVAVGRKAKM